MKWRYCTLQEAFDAAFGADAPKVTVEAKKIAVISDGQNTVELDRDAAMVVVRRIAEIFGAKCVKQAIA